MKKLVSLMLCFMLIFTQISYAETTNINNSIKDLDIVSNKINIMIKEITGDNPLDVDEFKKEIKYSESILGSLSKQLSNSYSAESNMELKRTYAALIYISSLYELSLSSMLVYVHNDTKSNYFVDTCATYKQGTISLDVIKSSYNNSN